MGQSSLVTPVVIADFQPTIFIGLALGSLLDRLPRQKLMVGADLARLLVFCYLPFARSATEIVVAAGVGGTAKGFFRPGGFAGMPDPVHHEDPPPANAPF